MASEGDITKWARAALEAEVVTITRTELITYVEQIDDLQQRILHAILVGGNHLALLISADHPAQPRLYLGRYRKCPMPITASYEAWCCWRLRYHDRYRAMRTGTEAMTFCTEYDAEYRAAIQGRRDRGRNTGMTQCGG